MHKKFVGIPAMYQLPLWETRGRVPKKNGLQCAATYVFASTRRGLAGVCNGVAVSYFITKRPAAATFDTSRLAEKTHRLSTTNSQTRRLHTYTDDSGRKIKTAPKTFTPCLYLAPWYIIRV